MAEDKVAKFFTHPYTIIFVLGCYTFMVISIIVHSVISGTIPDFGVLYYRVSIWGLVFMICLGLFLFGLWFHDRYRIIIRTKDKVK